MKIKVKKRWAIALSVLLALVVIRIIMPVVAENIINKRLSQLKEYEGHIENVDLFLIAGQYSIEGLVITKKEPVLEIPFVRVDDIKAKLQWSKLFEGEIVGQLILTKPVINFATGEDGELIHTGKGDDWVKTVKGLIPVSINKFEIFNGEIHYQDFSTEPKIDVFIQNLKLQMTNLTNIESSQKKLPAHLTLSGSTIGGGIVKADGSMNLLKQIPDMDINLSIKDVEMPALNDFLRAYTNTDAHNGTFDIFTEIAINDGKVAGYVKPVIRNLEIVQWQKENEPFLNKLWEGIVGGVAKLFENNEEDQLATIVPLQGDVKDLEVGVWPAVWNIFRNAFIEAFSRSVEGSITFGDA